MSTRIDIAGDVAEDPKVWIAIRRRGVDHHKLSDLTVNGVPMTTCDRSRASGVELPLSEVRTLYGDHPCKRCYPTRR